MSTIFLDASGYTGQDLLSVDQPVFTVATLCCPEATCQAWKRQFFGTVRAGELKYQGLCRRPGQRQMVLVFLQELAEQPGLVKLSITHKRYALIAKMVDMLVVLQDDYPEELSRALSLLRASYYCLAPQYVLDQPQPVLDIAFSSVFTLMTMWGKVSGDTIILIHDASSSMARERRVGMRRR